MDRPPLSSCERAAPEPDPEIVSAVIGEIEEGLRTRPRRPFVLGICGAQGSGKTTLAAHVRRQCEAQGLGAAVLSLDDLYLTRAERERLARDVHPLLRTRGVPGTHDVGLGLAVIAALERGAAVAMPRFDKAADDRAPESQWEVVPASCDVLIMEGWCLGARPQSDEALATPVNALEHDEDPDGVWRRYANAALAGGYQQLFARLDRLVLLQAPGFETVYAWRLQQEDELRVRAGPHAPGLMDAAGVARFIQHYERLTRHILEEMPARADLVFRLGADRSLQATRRRDGERQ